MGLVNTIIDKRTKCPWCGGQSVPLHYRGGRIDWQSKDLSDRGNCWELGEQITLGSGANLTFKSEDDAWWSGCFSCSICHVFIEARIVIEKGIITEIIPKTKEEMKCPKCKRENTYLNMWKEPNGKYREEIQCMDCLKEASVEAEI